MNKKLFFAIVIVLLTIFLQAHTSQSVTTQSSSVWLDTRKRVILLYDEKELGEHCDIVVTVKRRGKKYSVAISEVTPEDAPGCIPHAANEQHIIDLGRWKYKRRAFQNIKVFVNGVLVAR